MEQAEIREGNWFYSQHYVQKITVSPITLSRGVQFYDTDFYKWMMKAVEGIGVVKRDLMLVHYFAISPVTLAKQIAESPMVAAGSLAALAGIEAAMMAKIFAVSPSGGAQVLGGQGAGALLSGISAMGLNPPIDHAPRFPAKAWILRKCLPTRWKPGTDFDAMSGDISIAELEVQPHRIEELALGA